MIDVLRIPLQSGALAAMLLLARLAAADPGESLEIRAAQAQAEFDGAEQRFQPPSEAWFYDSQSALRDEVARVGAALDAMDPEEAGAWKSHLRWHLLEANLHSMSVNLGELELVRRWMFSNREGLEGPLFAELRERMDAHLDAAFAFSHDDLRATFAEKVALARQQCQAIAEQPSDARAVALGRTLGWLQRTGQLSSEIDEVRSLLSLPNAQIVVSTEFAQRLLGLFETDVDQTIRVVGTETAPPSGILRRRRTLRISGSANSVGSTLLEIVANEEEAQISLVFRGKVIAHCRADAGPAAIHMVTSGPIGAVKPIYISMAGLRLGETVVDSQVTTRLSGVTARRNFIRRIAQRRAEQPDSLSYMRSGGHTRTTTLLRDNLDERVDEVLAEIRAEIAQTQESMGSFREVLAPVVREGAVPDIQGLRSTLAGIELNIAGQRRHQFGAVVPYSSGAVGGDVQLRLHVSLVNNMLETILGGKTLSDEFLMRYAKILQAQLPLPLMVHSRSRRWAITTAKYRPLELRLPEPNRLQFVMRIEAVEIDGQTFDVPATATINYDLVKNDFDEYELVRDGEVQLETALPTNVRSFLHEKLDAFFAPLLNGGGVAVPDGGVLGAISGIEPAGVEVANDWIVIGLNVPDEVLDAVMRYRRSEADPAT
ncbi:MAG: hypothetical protein IH898_04600 [Planctomycetes bacterium]|nr:hypothetical protein [Planctomycetota bacterium]